MKPGVYWSPTITRLSRGGRLVDVGATTFAAAVAFAHSKNLPLYVNQTRVAKRKERQNSNPPHTQRDQIRSEDCQGGDSAPWSSWLRFYNTLLSPESAAQNTTLITGTEDYNGSEEGSPDVVDDGQGLCYGP